MLHRPFCFKKSKSCDRFALAIMFALDSLNHQEGLKMCRSAGMVGGYRTITWWCLRLAHVGNGHFC